MDAIRRVGTLLTLCGLFIFATPTFAAVTDLDADSIPDHEDPEVIVSTNASLSAGEYTFHNLLVSSSSILTLVGDPNSPTDFKGVKITADNITVENTSAISANGTGYRSFENSPGAGENHAGGYGYGGRGGDWSYNTSSSLGGNTYGSAFQPLDLGSGDGTYSGGGGAMWLVVSGILENNGVISANGVPQQSSGGSIYVQTGTLEGSGMFTANGTGCSWYYPYSGAGGGGRIAVYYSESRFIGNAEALRGGRNPNDSSCQGKTTGQDGTVAFIDTTHNDLYLKERFLFQASDYPYEFDRIVLSDGASVSFEPGVNITAREVVLNGTSTLDTTGVRTFTADSLIIDSGSEFISAEGLSLTLSSITVRNNGEAKLGMGETLSVDTIQLENQSRITATSMRVLHLEARDVIIDETSAITATGAGYGPRQGPGYNDSGAGASHGGLGERGVPSPVYGSATEPVDFGSGGSPDANGGGSIRLIVSGTLENNGKISADATPMKNGASGGSVYVTTNKLSGSGSFTALGGNTRGYITDVGAGGGGRIALYYQESDFVGTTSAKGGDRYVGGAIMQTYYAQDGTVVFKKEEPKGISNILFLPGIQASRLYTKNENGEEEKLWEPFGDDDVLQLAMTSTGESVNDIYTKDVVDELPNFSKIYKGFLDYLGGLDGDLAPRVLPFPYDWRQDVFDIVENGTKVESGLFKKPVSAVEYLATLSDTDKVTIIAHSNGGLLAKAIMLKLAEEGKANLVDKVIFIASPHTGTPKGIAALLHGYDQEYLGGLVSSDEAVRSVMKNMPGVYGLLPSESYVASLTEPMISFDDSTTTKIYRDAYGFTVSSVEEYTRFLKGIEGREDAGNNVYKPSTANTAMLDRALQEHREKLDTWTAPGGVEVYNIVGTGLPTPKSIVYREFMHTQCNVDRSVCIPAAKIEPRLYQTRYGDETVVSKSALLKENIFINLFLKGGPAHAKITESETTQILINRILHGSSTDDIDFVTKYEPTFNDQKLDVLELHSPAHMYIADSEGNITGKTELGGDLKEEIPGSSYFEFAGGKYLIVPNNLAYQIVIEGDGNGLYTHIASTLTGDAQTELHAFTATVTPEMVATYEKTEDGFSTIRIDDNGDGEIDKEMTLEGEILNKNATYEDLIGAIRAAGLPWQLERHILEKMVYAKRLLERRTEKVQNEHLEEVTLSALMKSFEQFKKQGLLTNVQYEESVTIIRKLIEQ